MSLEEQIKYIEGEMRLSEYNLPGRNPLNMGYWEEVLELQKAILESLKRLKDLEK